MMRRIPKDGDLLGALARMSGGIPDFAREAMVRHGGDAKAIEAADREARAFTAGANAWPKKFDFSARSPEGVAEMSEGIPGILFHQGRSSPVATRVNLQMTVLNADTMTAFMKKAAAHPEGDVIIKTIDETYDALSVTDDARMRMLGSLVARGRISTDMITPEQRSAISQGSMEKLMNGAPAGAPRMPDLNPRAGGEDGRQERILAAMGMNTTLDLEFALEAAAAPRTGRAARAPAPAPRAATEAGVAPAKPSAAWSEPKDNWSDFEP